MKLPNAEKAVVERQKITEYLLNAAHPDNGGKAAFFEALGFHREEPQALAEALLDFVRQSEVVHSLQSPHGRKYIVVGRIKSARSKTLEIRTVWIIDKGSDVARLVTAYPAKHEG
jgi:hypothetical protein